MARIRMLPMREANWFVRACNWFLSRRLGEPSPATPLLGHNPNVLLSFMGYGAGYARWKTLPERLKTLIHVRVAMRVGCPA